MINNIGKITKRIFIFTFFIVNISCKKEETAPMPTQMEMDAIIAAVKGAFMASAHATSGIASINKEKTMLHFANFKTDTGPDLNIYLVSDLSKVLGDFVDLGDIKGVKGDYMYDVPANTDFSKYKYVVVWCVDFKVNFGYAELKP